MWTYTLLTAPPATTYQGEPYAFVSKWQSECTQSKEWSKCCICTTNKDYDWNEKPIPSNSGNTPSLLSATPKQHTIHQLTSDLHLYHEVHYQMNHERAICPAKAKRDSIAAPEKMLHGSISRVLVLPLLITHPDQKNRKQSGNRNNKSFVNPKCVKFSNQSEL